MKTQTSKKGIWLRSLIILPILAILFFSFSTKVIVLEEKTNKEEQELISNQEKASKKQIAEYNSLAKKYNDMPEDNLIIRKKDLERIKELYHLMSEEQKKNAQPFPNIPAPLTPDALDAPKVIEGEIIHSPSPAPLPDNAIPAQNKKYKEAIKDYKLKTQKVELQKIKERELIKVRKIKDEKAAVILKYVEEKKQLKTEQRVYKEAQVLKLKAQKGELVRVRELRSVEDRKKLQTAKRAYKEAQVAAKVFKLKAQKGELVRVRELRSVENRKKLQAEKRTYKEAQVAAKVVKLKAQKGELVRVRELRIEQDKERVKEAKKVYIKAKALNEEVEVEELVEVEVLVEVEELTIEEVASQLPPKSPIEHLQEMAKKGAKFFFKGKSISPEKAIKLLRTKKDLKIRTNHSNDTDYIVNLSTKQ